MHSREADRRGKRGEEGFSLIVVLWMIAILAALASLFATTSSTHIKSSRNAIDNARAEALADAGVMIAIYTLTQSSKGSVPRRAARAGEAALCNMGGGDWISIELQDENGKVDLNAADERLIAATFTAAGFADEDSALTYAARIADYRDVDSTRRTSGAELEDYRIQNRPGPKNQPFDVIEEVEQVLGVPSGAAAAIQPYATVYTGKASFEPVLALPSLISAAQMIPGAGIKASAPGRTAAALASGGPSSLGRVITITAAARTEQGATFVREAIVEFTPNQPGTYQFRRWRRAAKPAAGLLTAPRHELPRC